MRVIVAHSKPKDVVTKSQIGEFLVLSGKHLPEQQNQILQGYGVSEALRRIKSRFVLDGCGAKTEDVHSSKF